MAESKNHNLKQPADLKSPDFTRIREKPSRVNLGRAMVLVLKIFVVILIIILITAGIMAALYYHNFKKAADLSFAAKNNLEQALHKVINREFIPAADLIKQANLEFHEAKTLLDKVVIVRRIPYLGKQVLAVDNLLVAGIKLTNSGEKVILLLNDIIEPLHNESITYATITPAQKFEILNKIVKSEGLLYEVKQDVDDAVLAIEAIPQDGLVRQLKDGIAPLKENLPKAKILIDNALPMLKIIPKIAGFVQPKSYLFLLQNNSELRPTGGFIGTYGILKLADGEMKEFDTDNIYNLDRSTQHVIKEPAPWQIEKYLDQKDWALRDINWAPDFPTTAKKAMEMYDKENQVLADMKASGQKIIGEKGVEIADIIPYEKNLFGVIAMTPEILGGLLKLTGPVVAGDMVFSDTNYQEQLELMVGKLYQELNIPIAERKGIIKQLADQIKVKLMTLPFSQLPQIFDIMFAAMDQKQIMIYCVDPEIEQLVLDRNWGGAVKSTDSDYLFVVDSNLASLKTDQFVKRSINYSFKKQNNDYIAKVSITYNNNAEFTWKSSRLRTYTRVYLPLGSELIKAEGAMENDKIRDPNRQVGKIEVAEDYGKTFFGAFIAIEPKESGTLSFEYKLPSRIKEQIDNGRYNLLIQKQPGVLPDLTLDLNFDKTIKSASPAEAESEWFNTSYDYQTALNADKQILVSLK